MSKRQKQSRSQPSKKVLIELFNSDFDSDSSDLIIFVGEKKFRVHKEFLASKSDYFRGLLFSGLKESSEKEIKLAGTTPEVFHLILKYFYNGVLDINSIEHSQAVDLLTICHEWLLTEVFDHFKKNRNQNVNFLLFEVASNLDLQDIKIECLEFWEKSAEEFLKHPYFLKLDVSKLCNIIKRDTFFVKEELIFEAVLRWSKKVSEDDINLVLESIRFPLMDEIYLLEEVVDSGVVDHKLIFNAAIAQRKADKDELNFRGIHVFNKEMIKETGKATIEFKPDADDDCNCNCHNSEYYYDDDDDDYVTKDITITLNTPCFLNYIKIKYGDEFHSSEDSEKVLSLSADGKFWHNPNNGDEHDGYYKFCFPKRVVKFIKLTGAEIHRHNDPEIGNFEAFLKDPEQDANETDGESSE